MDDSLKSPIALIRIRFQARFNSSIFDGTDPEVSINPVFRVFVRMLGLTEAFLRFGLRVFLDHGGQVGEQGGRVKVLFHDDGGMSREVFDFTCVLEVII
jgi:hypothetical protein